MPWVCSRTRAVPASSAPTGQRKPLPGGSCGPPAQSPASPDAARAQFQAEIAEREARDAAEAARRAAATGQSGLTGGTNGDGENPGDGTDEGGDEVPGGTGDVGGTGGVTPLPPEPEPDGKKKRFTATFDLPVSGGGPGLYMRIDDEILHHFRSLEADGGSVRVTVDVEATAPEGFDEKTCSMIDGSLAEMKDAEGSFE